MRARWIVPWQAPESPAARDPRPSVSHEGAFPAGAPEERELALGIRLRVHRKVVNRKLKLQEQGIEGVYGHLEVPAERYRAAEEHKTDVYDDILRVALIKHLAFGRGRQGDSSRYESVAFKFAPREDDDIASDF